MKLKNVLVFLFISFFIFSAVGCQKEKKQSILVKYSAEDVQLLRAVTYDPEKDPDYPTEKKIQDIEAIKKVMETINDQPVEKTAPNPITKFDITYFITMKNGDYHTYILTNDEENGHRIIYNNLSYRISENSYKKLHSLYETLDAKEATAEIQNVFK